MHYVFVDIQRKIQRTLWQEDPQKVIDWIITGVNLGQQWEYMGAIYPSVGAFPIIAEADPVNQWLEEWEG